MDIARITLDIPIDLNEKVNESVKNTRLSKAQYIRMSLEVMNMISNNKDGELFFIKGRAHITDIFLAATPIPSIIFIQNYGASPGI